MAIKVKRAIDLTRQPFDTDVAKWCDPEDYSACQSLASAAREAGAQLIRSLSARDTEARANIALLDPAGFAAQLPTFRQTWHFRFERGRLSAIAAFPGGGAFQFEPAQFGLV